MQLGDPFSRGARPIVPIAGIGFQWLPENNGILPKLGCLVGLGRNSAISSHRAIHQVAGQLLSSQAPGGVVCFIQRTAINSDVFDVIPEEPALVGQRQVGSRKSRTVWTWSTLKAKVSHRRSRG